MGCNYFYQSEVCCLETAKVKILMKCYRHGIVQCIYFFRGSTSEVKIKLNSRTDYLLTKQNQRNLKLLYYADKHALGQRLTQEKYCQNKIIPFHVLVYKCNSHYRYFQNCIEVSDEILYFYINDCLSFVFCITTI